ncbi:hypothetical protein DI005_22835 [Prauserella sp. PE36]|uniref:putative T7SS-secreted protein n=1 Tax=Prauserella sp. PE36 TaxID=1504709 RepID=UPI000DE1B01C|nr:hypothetical protein [Prauserella sp. PE36]RBM17132.1 hypothetical protein DI005_22835 [Prauserella sp. PE36]
MAELGQTDDPSDLIPGDPATISSDLRELVGTITTADEISARLGRIDPVQWVGEASEAFRSAFGDEPPKWAHVVEAAGRGGQALCDFADVLTWGQGEAQRAIELYHQAQAASRAAAARYDALAQSAKAGGQTLGPFQDPGVAAAQEAQAILNAARQQVEQAGGEVASALGFEPDGEGGYTRTFGQNEWGAGRREMERHWDPATGRWVEQDPGGWQENDHGRSYRREWGSQADGLMHDSIRRTLAEFGIEVPFADALGLNVRRSETGAATEWVGGEAERSFAAGGISGRGSAEGSLLGANAGAYNEVTENGVTAGANAEAYLARGSVEGEVDLGHGVDAAGSAAGMVGASAGAEGNVDAFGAQGNAEAFVGARAEAAGELNLGPHAGVSASGEAMAGAEASARGSVGLSGAEVSGEAFAGARASGEVGAEVAGVGAGVNGEAWAGVGVEGSAQFGMGDDGQFHVGASAGAAFGVGGRVGFDVTIDPGGVAEAVNEAAGAVGGVASDVRETVGGAPSDMRGAVGAVLGF